MAYWSGCGAVSAAAARRRSGPAAIPMFTLDQFRRLAFLEGRWTGNGPNGASFFEEDAFVDTATLRSTRYADAC